MAFDGDASAWRRDLPPRRPDVDVVEAHQAGYLRRPELDRDHYVVWEAPDGALLACDPAMSRHLMIAIWREIDWMEP